MDRTRQTTSLANPTAAKANRYAARLIVASAASVLIAFALSPAKALGPTAGDPSATSLRILEEAQSGKGLSERFNLPRSLVQIGLPRFDSEPALRLNLPGPNRR